MANTVKKLVDTNRRVVYSLTGDVSEGAAPVLKIDAGALNFSQNANNFILGAGTDRKPVYGLSLQKVIYSVNGGAPTGYVTISTNGDTPNTIVQLSGAGTMAFNEGGDSFTLNVMSYANSTGNVFLTTVGFSGNTSYTVILDFKKNPSHYDQGQTADPKAFNR